MQLKAETTDFDDFPLFLVGSEAQHGGVDRWRQPALGEDSGGADGWWYNCLSKGWPWSSPVWTAHCQGLL